MWHLRPESEHVTRARRSTGILPQQIVKLKNQVPNLGHPSGQASCNKPRYSPNKSLHSLKGATATPSAAVLGMADRCFYLHRACYSICDLNPLESKRRNTLLQEFIDGWPGVVVLKASRFRWIVGPRHESNTAVCYSSQLNNVVTSHFNKR